MDENDVDGSSETWETTNDDDGKPDVRDLSGTARTEDLHAAASRVHGR